MRPTTRSTKEQNSTLACAKIKGKSKRKREKERPVIQSYP